MIEKKKTLNRLGTSLRIDKGGHAYIASILSPKEVQGSLLNEAVIILSSEIAPTDNPSFH